jgi:hypothetical protein
MEVNVSFTLQVVFPREKSPLYTFDRRLGFDKYEYFMSLKRNENLAVHVVASTLLTELIQLSGKFIVFALGFN